MKKDKHQSSFVNIGSASLLIIFLVLSLVAFAVLSLVSAHSDYKLTRQLAEHKAEYYKASVRAEEILAEMDAVFEEQAAAAGNDLEAYSDAVLEILQEDVLEDTTGCTYTRESDEEDEKQDPDSLGTLKELGFTIPISPEQDLEVLLNIHDYTQQDTYYDIKAWQAVSTAEWEGDQSIQLLPMGE